MNTITHIRTVRGFVITLRPIVSMVAILWAAGMVIIASALYEDFQEAMFCDSEFYLKFFLVIIASFLGVAGGYALNDYFDYRIDRANPARTDKVANPGIEQHGKRKSNRGAHFSPQ